ncbi:MAG: signal recognition particle protein [Gammaproteobacteria bacterium]|jgi:signal recognition particle subunit SRP54
MFDNLSERLTQSLNRLRGRGRLTEANIKDTLREVRMALLEADVALPVAREFIENIRERAVGQAVLKSLTPGQELIRIVRNQLILLLGEANEGLNLNVPPPAVLLVAGLQGSGKTTSVAKLARWLKERNKKSVLVASCDIYRPAAIAQLEMLAKDVGAGFFPSDASQHPVAIAKAAVEQARRQFADVVILDTAGRLHIDEGMMDEVRRVHEAIKPVETLFVVDSMTGQDAANVSRAFDQALPLTGVVLTKTDGDARGGAALSIRRITGKPIKFIGMGEKTAALEPFYPDRIASRILGMGDVLSLIEEAEQKIDRDQAQRIADKLKKGKGFDLEDFREQLQQMKKLGGMTALLDKLPGMQGLPQGVADRVNDRELLRLEAIINSMTRQERRFPAVVNGSRKRRIASGSGTTVQDVNRLLKQFTQMQKMMKRLNKKGALSGLMRGMTGRGGMPPGMPL